MSIYIYVLFFGSIVGAGNTHREFDWRALGEFRGKAACVEAARQLSIKPEQYRCVNTGRT